MKVVDKKMGLSQKRLRLESDCPDSEYVRNSINQIRIRSDVREQ